MFSNKISKEKELLIRLATDKNGNIKFKSKLLYNNPYLYSSNEDLRYYLWMIELSIYIGDNLDCSSIHCSFDVLNINKLENELLYIINKIK